MLAKVGDSEVNLFGMSIQSQDYLDSLSNAACFIWQTIDIVDRDWMVELPGGEFVVFHISLVHKQAGHATVYQCRSGSDFGCVCFHPQFKDRKIDYVQAVGVHYSPTAVPKMLFTWPFDHQSFF